MEGIAGGLWSNASPVKKHEIASKKYLTAKKAGGIAQVVECFPSKYKTLSSSSIPPKKLKNKSHNILPVES
jgi:hypothetical protein